MNKKLKIAIIGSRGYPYVYSGYETLVKELSERLVKKGHTVRVYCHKYLFENRPKKINGIEPVQYYLYPGVSTEPGIFEKVSITFHWHRSNGLRQNCTFLKCKRPGT